MSEESTEATLQQLARFLREICPSAWLALEAGQREALLLLRQAHENLSARLGTHRIAERDLLDCRLLVLRALSGLRAVVPTGDTPGARLLQVIEALEAVPDCFIEYELFARPVSLDLEKTAEEDYRMVSLAEFSIELFEVRLHALQEALQSLTLLASTDEVVLTQANQAQVQSFSAAVGYLETIQRYAIPGCIYGAQARRENPYLAARALRAGGSRLKGLMSGRLVLSEPLERLARVEGRLTRVIEEVRELGAPLEEQEGLIRRIKTSRLDPIRLLIQELAELEIFLDERRVEREQYL